MHGITDTEDVRPGDVAPDETEAFDNPAGRDVVGWLDDLRPDVPVSLEQALAPYRARTDARRAGETVNW